MTSAMTMTKTHTKTKTKTKTKVLKRPNMCYIFEMDMTVRGHFVPRISNMMMVGELVMMHWG